MDSYRENLFKDAKPSVFGNARQLRQNSTEAEIILWEELRNRKLNGLKFRRQHPLGIFIADFYCHEKKLVIELDGNVHDSGEQKEYDKGRTYELNDLGVRVIRFRNDEVMNNLQDVLKKIAAATSSRPSP